VLKSTIALSNNGKLPEFAFGAYSSQEQHQ
jgi:hypothetical protein